MPRKLTTEEFIERAQKIHETKYDYSKIEYKNAYTGVKIICPMHGVFKQKPIYHLKGSGCQKCARESSLYKKRKTKEEFIEQANKIHGNKYDYSSTVYEGAHKTITIICPKHGTFKQKAGGHLAGRGCPECGKLVSLNTNKKQLTNEEFIKKAIKLHPEYDYSKINYKNMHTKIEIICPEHGSFWQTPANHLQPNFCPECSNVKRITTNKFIEKAKKIHGDKYDYSLVNYINSKIPVKIICPEHGVFEQKPKNHLKGSKCFKCSKNFSPTAAEFLAECQKVHSKKYSYNFKSYKNLNSNLEITCPVHGKFKQLAKLHLKGSGCPQCSSSGFNLNLPAILYFIQDNETNLFKVGVTNRSVAERFALLPSKKITVLREFFFEKGNQALLLENKILKEFVDKRTYNEKWPRIVGGNTEFFIEDISKKIDEFYNKELYGKEKDQTYRSCRTIPKAFLL